MNASADGNHSPDPYNLEQKSIDLLMSAIMPRASDDQKIQVKSRLLDLGLTFSDMKDFAAKSKKMERPHRLFLNAFVSSGASAEQSLAFIDAPKFRAGDDKRETWVEMMDQRQESKALRAEALPSEAWDRSRYGASALFVIAAATPMLIFGAASYLSNNTIVDGVFTQTLDSINRLTSGLLSTALGAGAGLAGALGGSLSLAQLGAKWYAQRIRGVSLVNQMDDTSSFGFSHIFSDKNRLHEEAEKLKPADRMLLTHLSKSNLAIFLLSDDQARKDMLLACPPSFEQRLHSTLARHSFKQILPLGSELLTLMVSPWGTPEKLSSVGFEACVNRMREHKNPPPSSSVSLAPTP